MKPLLLISAVLLFSTCPAGAQWKVERQKGHNSRENSFVLSPSDGRKKVKISERTFHQIKNGKADPEEAYADAGGHTAKKSTSESDSEEDDDANMNGRIESFTTTSGSNMKINGMPYEVQNSGKSWSLKKLDDYSLRFEVNPGDTWVNDPEDKERSEVKQEKVYPPGQFLTASYRMLVEPGEKNTAEWSVIGQFHADDNYTSPTFAMELQGEKLICKLRYKEGGEIKDKIFTLADAIERGRYYRVKVKTNFVNGRDGSLQVWLDREMLVNYRGPIGYGYGQYWKYGFYRYGSKEKLAIIYSNMHVRKSQNQHPAHSKKRRADGKK